eukprot:7264838-Pyramimonas_sp.AAC.1
MADVVLNAIQATLPAPMHKGILENIEHARGMQPPTARNLRRYRLILDVALLLAAQRMNDANVVRYMWIDSSPNKFANWLWTECHQIPFDRLYNVFDAAQLIESDAGKTVLRDLALGDDDPDPDTASLAARVKAALGILSECITHHVYVPQALGSGKANTPHKAASLLHCICLESPTLASVARHISSFVSVTTDMG